MNAQKITVGGLLAVILALGFSQTVDAGIIRNGSQYPIYIQGAYYSPTTGFAWGNATLLQPGAELQVQDGSNVFIRAQNLNGTWGPAHKLGYGTARDYLFVSGATVYIDVTRR